MRNLLTLIALTFSLLVFSQKSNEKYTFSKMAKVESDGTFTYKEFNGHIDIKYEDTKPGYADVHFCGDVNHYDLIMASKHISDESSTNVQKSKVRSFVVKDYRDETSKTFDVTIIEWFYTETNKLYYSIIIDGVTYHYQVKKRETFTNGKLINSVEFEQ